jgi:hypothetical protein
VRYRALPRTVDTFVLSTVTCAGLLMAVVLLLSEITEFIYEVPTFEVCLSRATCQSPAGHACGFALAPSSTQA